MLISKYRQREEYEKAEELIQSLPDENCVDKKLLWINLCIDQGKMEEASRKAEEKLLLAAGQLQTILLTLMEIALKEGRPEDARHIADVSEGTARLLESWEFNFYTAHFQLYMALKDKANCLRVWELMMRALTQEWKPSESPLYRHIQQKEAKDWGLTMKRTLSRLREEDEEAEFLREDERWKELDFS